jgi:hypothetical protein
MARAAIGLTTEKDRGSRCPWDRSRGSRLLGGDRSSTDSTPRDHFLCETA